MKNYIILLLTALTLGLSSCEVDEILNPNSPTVESFENGATLADLQLLAQGLEAVIRNDMQFHYWTTNIIGREYYDLRGTDPRYTSELLGQNGGVLDNNGFLTTRSYFARYRSVRNALLLKNAVANTVATLSQGEVNAFNGYANTIQGYEMLLEAMRQEDNGIRLDVSDVNNLGPFTGSLQESLDGIRVILDEGYNQLRDASADFPWSQSSDGFSSIPGTEAEAMAQFNRAIAARLDIYRGNKSSALSTLENSFLDLDGTMDVGVYYSFGGATGNDLQNPLFYIPDTDLYLAHPSWIEDATEGDARLSKAVLLDEELFSLPIILDGLSGSYQVRLYDAFTAPASIIRNEELILIYAEANIGSDNDEAVNAINVIRSAAGLDDYDGGTSDGELLDEVLYQRRYSLFGEGHRWIDARRTGNLDDIPTDRDGDVVHERFPRPASEV